MAPLGANKQNQLWSISYVNLLLHSHHPPLTPSLSPPLELIYLFTIEHHWGGGGGSGDARNALVSLTEAEFSHRNRKVVP